uniref:MH2 domain-containing protein n=1 Tax=Panagrolaimus sp. JU765 TaxID=591449 RepID=A0AC34Q353_9BILA
MTEQYRQQQFQQWSDAMDTMPSTSSSYYQQQPGRMTNPNQQRLPFTNPPMFAGQNNPNFALQQQQFRMNQDNPFATSRQQFGQQGQSFPPGPGVPYGQQLGQQQQQQFPPNQYQNQYRQQLPQQLPQRFNYPVGRPPLSSIKQEFPQMTESAPGPSRFPPPQSLPANPFQPQPQPRPSLPQTNQFMNYPTPPPPSQTPQRFEQPFNQPQVQQQPPPQPQRFQQPIQQFNQPPRQQPPMMSRPVNPQIAQLQQEQRNAFFRNVAPMMAPPIKTEEYLMDTDINPTFQNIQQTNEPDYYKKYLTEGAKTNEITGFQEYMRDRKIVPAAYMGARCINPGSGVSKGGPVPKLEFPIEPIDKLNLQAPKENFIRRIKMALKCAQYLPSKEEFDRTVFGPPEVMDELSNSWCHIHYYEFESRVGQTFCGASSTITIDGLCAPSTISSNTSRFSLGAIGNPNRDPVAVSARRQIGKGWQLILKDGNISLESNSDAAVFVQSPVHAKQQGDHLATVYRLPAKQSMNVFNYEFFMKTLNEAIKRNQYDGCYAMKSLCHMRMSFVKGWGERYRRQTITYTPCWVEIHLVQMLQAIDDALQNMHAPDCDGHSDS